MTPLNDKVQQLEKGIADLKRASKREKGIVLMVKTLTLAAAVAAIVLKWQVLTPQLLVLIVGAYYVAKFCGRMFVFVSYGMVMYRKVLEDNPVLVDYLGREDVDIGDFLP